MYMTIVMLKENSERKIAAPGGTRTHNFLLLWQMLYLVPLQGHVQLVELGC